MGVGRGRGDLVLWILNISAKKSCFLNFEWEKTNFTTFGPPPGKILEKSPSGPPGKNPSDAHGCHSCFKSDMIDCLLYATKATLLLLLKKEIISFV